MSDTSRQIARPVQPWQVGLLFGALVVGLASIYYLFLRVDFATLQSGLRTAESALIVSELDRQGYDYKLASGGSEIQVRSDEVDQIRVAIAGAGIQAGGQDGFELFNESEMGLTDFAQKIKYLRALQGELSRTIMMIEGVEDARVHLAIPERTLFRSERSLTKAAVSLVLIKERTPSPEMVIGIQRLVSSSVPELKASNVIVLDRTGATLSQTKTDDEPPQLEPDRSPLAVAVRGIVARSLPGMRSSVLVTGKPPPARTDINVETYQEVIATAEISTKDPLISQQKDRIIESLMADGLLAPEDRNVVTFEILDPTLTYDSAWAAALPPTSRAPTTAPAQNGRVGLSNGFAFFGPSVFLWAGGILALLAAALAALLTWRKSSRKSGLSNEERQSRADELRQILDAYRKSVLTNGR